MRSSRTSRSRAQHRHDGRARVVVQSGSTVLGAERMHGAEARHERVVDVVVELLERRHQFRVLAHLRSDRNELALRILDEVPMRRNLSDEQVRWIGEARASESNQRDRCACHGRRKEKSSFHPLPFSPRVSPFFRANGWSHLVTSM
jgi:hypothetical protein